MSDHKCAPEATDRVLAYFAHRGDTAISRDALAGAVGMSVTNTARALRELCATGRLQIVRRGTGPGYPTSYRVASTDPLPNPHRPPAGASGRVPSRERAPQ